LKVDVNLRERLLSTSKFDTMKRHVDEEEHSGEMQYPFIAKIIKDTTDNNGKRHDVSILPIMIGSIQTSKEEEFGKLLSPYLSHTSVFTVISSDFCHCE
jgi:AmmeMemoRadiSam system protein B